MDKNLFDLPIEVVQFLAAGRQLEYDEQAIEAGVVKLKRLEELSLGEVWIGTDMPGDPKAGEPGYYAIPAMSLTGECEDYDPEFILLWLPNEHLFGTWDCDHWTLKVFRGVTWADIVANPAVYINAQWDAHSKVGEPLTPWPRYAFKPGRPF